MNWSISQISLSNTHILFYSIPKNSPRFTFRITLKQEKKNQIKAFQNDTLKYYVDCLIFFQEKTRSTPFVACKCS